MGKQARKAGRKPGKAKKRKQKDRKGLDRDELVTLVCKYLCKGMTASEVVRIVKAERGVVITREEPYQMFCYAARKGWIQFMPPLHHVLREMLKDRYGPFQGLEVVHTAVVDDVMFRGAQMLLELLQQYGSPPNPKKEVHLGFAGGHSMRKLAVALARLLPQPISGLPEKIVFHSLVTGFDVFRCTTDPNALFLLFDNNPAMQVETAFVGMHAPALVTRDQFKQLKGMTGIREAYDLADQLDIIVTSASLRDDPDSQLRKHMAQDPASTQALEEAGWIGDMLWRPIGPDGPIDIDTDIRAMTLLELGDLSRMIDDGKHVLLTLGPCGRCDRLKTDLLRAMLKMPRRLFTHLAVDSRTARELVNREGLGRLI